MVSVKADPAVALTMLMDRLSWPVKMVRWKTAKAIKGLIEEASTHDPAVAALLRWIGQRRFESEVVSGLSVLLVVTPESRPSLETVRTHIAKPSLLSEMLIERMYSGPQCSDWKDRHSGEAPKGFAPSEYFQDHRGAQVPQIFSSTVERLDSLYGLPFTIQWAHEWQILTEETQTAKTGYPHHFGDFGLQRSGVIGQFVQRQGEVYRSAYLRMLAFAVSSWGMPSRTAADYVLFAMSILPELFEVEPQGRPQWLGDLPGQCLEGGADLEAIGRRIIQAGTNADSCVVSLGTPLPVDIGEFCDLTISAFFITDDFVPSEGQVLEQAVDFFFPDHLGFNTTRDDLRIKPVTGRSGRAVSVCTQALPVFHGFWHDDYFQRGLSLPAPYCFEETSSQIADASGIKILLGKKQVAEAKIWNDVWSPLYARGNSTRCGIVTTLRNDKLHRAAEQNGMKIGWYMRLSSLQREDPHGDLVPTIRDAFFRWQE